MARIDSLGNFLTDVADAIRTKKGTTNTIPANTFDTEIASIETGGGDNIDDYLNPVISAGTEYHDMTKTGWFKTILSIRKEYIISGTNMSYMFSKYTFKDFPTIDTSSVINFYYAFGYITNSDITTIPQYDFSSGKDLRHCFYSSTSLIDMPLLDFSSATDLRNCFYGCSNLTNLVGFKDLGKAYLTNTSANHSLYRLDLSYCTSLTEQSLINVLNNLYDIATKGCKTQQVILGSTNLAKLTSEEGQTALTNATAKGWTIS